MFCLLLDCRISFNISLFLGQEDLTSDSRGIPGWEKVDALAEYLVRLNRTITALGTYEATEIMRLYSCLRDFDQKPPAYQLTPRKNPCVGPWRASRKRSGSAPSVQASER